MVGAAPDRSPVSSAVAIGLLPATGCYWMGSALHRFLRSLRRHRLPVPAIAVGGLTAGGEGKTPVASWIAGLLAGDGRTPAIVMRGYGGDEQLAHRELVPGITVVCGADRTEAADRAVAFGADTLVLDDAFQHTELAPDLNVAVVAAEHLPGSRLLLPSGRWRERIAGLRRADAVVITRKTASDAAVAEACDLVAEMTEVPPFRAHLRIAGYTRLEDGCEVAGDRLSGSRVLAVAGIGNPRAFFEQLESAFGEVACLPLRDHHRYGDASIRSLVREASGVDYVVVTLKDAVKLRGRWPTGSPPLLVAGMELRWEYGGVEISDMIRAAAGPGG